MKQKSGKHNSSRRLRPADIAAALILLALAGAAIQAGVSYLQFLRLDLLTLETSSYQETIPAELLVIRQESVVTAPAAGYFEPSVASGSRVSAGGQIGEMVAEPSGVAQHLRLPVVTGQGGLVFFELDGWETALSVAAISQLDLSQLLLAWEGASVTAVAEPASLAAGRPLARVVDNLVEPHFLIYCQQPPQGLIEDGRLTLGYATAVTDAPPNELRVTVYEQGLLADGRSFLLASSNASGDILLTERQLEVELLGEISSGLYLPAAALCRSADGTDAVLVASRRRLELVPVTLCERQGQLVRVEGLTLGQRVVLNPESAQEGQRVY